MVLGVLPWDFQALCHALLHSRFPRAREGPYEVSPHPYWSQGLYPIICHLSSGLLGLSPGVC